MTAKRDGVGGASEEGSVRFEKYIKYLSGRIITSYPLLSGG